MLRIGFLFARQWQRAAGEVDARERSQNPRTAPGQLAAAAAAATWSRLCPSSATLPEQEQQGNQK